MSRVFRSLEGKIPERSIHFSDIVVDQLLVGSSGKLDEKEVKDQELVWLENQIEQKKLEIDDIRNQAEAIIENSRLQALELVDQAKGEADMIREVARQEGWQKGYQEGFENGQIEVQKYIDHAASVLREAEKERLTRIVSSESFMIDLTMAAMESIAGNIVKSSEHYIVELIQTLLPEVERAFKVEIRVSPEDFPKVIHFRNSFERAFAQRVELLMVPDRSLTAGDAVVLTEYGTVDGRLGTRLEQLHKVLTSIAKEWEDRAIASAQGD